ncbi:MAG: 3-hydroxybutyrate dehydrogenase [Acidobacteriaceae bacterium]|nr:3-hydroxybutyrate dehydrogenase [Acidobacteriaceae bacterium]
MNIHLAGKTAIVTGAASGIGLAIAKVFAEAGANVVVADLDSATGEQACAELRASGATCEFIQTDVANTESVQRMVTAGAERFGGIDVLVNNAGLQYIAPVIDFPEERWNLLINVILTGTFLCSKYVLPHMIRRRWGRVINIASFHAKVASPFKSAYIAAKHGVLGFTKTLALEVADHNITCNAICPAYVRTPLVEKQISDQAARHGIPADQVVARIMTEPAAIHRLLEPEEVASLALYLASEFTNGITGAAFDIDLGWMAR